MSLDSFKTLCADHMLDTAGIIDCGLFIYAKVYQPV